MIIVAPTAFKGTLPAAEAARALARGVARAAPDSEVRELPLSDGGPGLLDALAVVGLHEQHVRVDGPLGDPVRARFGLGQGLAVVETAEACGLHLVPEERRDPMRASTRGVGALILAALASSRSRGQNPQLVLGLGGSATVDGGLGMASALGWRLLDDAGRPVPPGGQGLESLSTIHPPAGGWNAPARVTALSDVSAPLVGERGAARVFGPQKGASPADVERLEAGLARLGDLLTTITGNEVASRPGAGAAGGLGAAAVAFLGAELRSGSDWVLERTGARALLARATLVVTGEGSVDAQTGMGKLVGEVMDAARREGVPVLVIAGRIEGALPEGVRGFDGAGAVLDEEALAALAERGVLALGGRRA